MYLFRLRSQSISKGPQVFRERFSIFFVKKKKESGCGTTIFYTSYPSSWLIKASFHNALEEIEGVLGIGDDREKPRT